MDSTNITHVPLNREGALELGVNPCKYCDSGWGNYGVSSDGKIKTMSCHDTCDYFKRYSETIVPRIVK